MSSYYHPFESSESTFEDRVGPPDEVTSGLGHILVGFSWLESDLNAYISKLATRTPSFAVPPMAELSFSKKVAVLSDLVRLQLPFGKFNTGNEDPAEVWDDFVRMLLKCERFRNNLIGPNLSPHNPTYTASRPSGPVKLWSHGLTGDDLIDISDYIKMVDYDLTQFFLLLDDDDYDVPPDGTVGFAA